MTHLEHSSAKSPNRVVKDFGFAEDLNPRFRRTMEDGHVYRDTFGPGQNLALCAVFDGHGGRETVDYLTQHFHKTFHDYLLEHPNRNEKSYPDVMTEVFARVDQELSDQNIVDDGSTGCVVLIERSGEPENETLHIISANCGDARTVFVQDNESYRVSRDHKPTDPREVARIKAADCFIVQGRVCGVLAVSRSFGDHTLKEAVISTPFVSTLRLTQTPQPSPTPQQDIQNSNDAVIHLQDRELTTPSILIIACDGVWDVLSDEEAADIALSHADTAQHVADALLSEAMNRMTTDNVSVMVLLLSPPASPEYLAQCKAKKEEEKRKKEEEEETKRKLLEEENEKSKNEEERKRKEEAELQIKQGKVIMGEGEDGKEYLEADADTEQQESDSQSEEESSPEGDA
ncbi:putative Protein phosphatase 2C [Blattamonas nauphoetae]|uniref:PPM-type phosphatase domain-containing protein n=1 Tax=Blattamonas nauphoetae TaxID=2049346 RepID=A0ABQ9YET4_9EUKA|nr:putative Protein phosphatase 2C [Blattamonas nauphoetae]